MPRSKAPTTAQSVPAKTPPAQAQATKPSASPEAPAGETAKEATPKTVVSINPAMLLLGGIGGELETAVDPTISLFAAPAFIFGNPLFAGQTGVSTSGFGLDVGLRYFAGQEAPKGFWLGPYGGIAFVNATAGTIKVNATAVGVGGMLGYSWITNGFYFSLGGGGGYRTVMVDSNSTTAAAAGGAALTLRLAIGFAQ